MKYFVAFKLINDITKTRTMYYLYFGYAQIFFLHCNPSSSNYNHKIPFNYTKTRQVAIKQLQLHNLILPPLTKSYQKHSKQNRAQFDI